MRHVSSRWQIADEDGDYPLHCAAHAGNIATCVWLGVWLGVFRKPAQLPHNACVFDSYEALQGTPGRNLISNTTAEQVLLASRSAWISSPPALTTHGFRFAEREGSTGRSATTEEHVVAEDAAATKAELGQAATGGAGKHWTFSVTGPRDLARRASEAPRSRVNVCVEPRVSIARF